MECVSEVSHRTVPGLSLSIDCPVCGKKEIREHICPRCETDITVLMNIKRGAETLAALARTALRDMNTKKALNYAKSSWALKKNRPAAQTAFLACCAERNYTPALKWYHRSLPDEG